MIKPKSKMAFLEASKVHSSHTCQLQNFIDKSNNHTLSILPFSWATSNRP